MMKRGFLNSSKAKKQKPNSGPAVVAAAEVNKGDSAPSQKQTPNPGPARVVAAQVNKGDYAPSQKQQQTVPKVTNKKTANKGVKKGTTATKVDLSNMIVMTTIPPIGAQRDPGGHSECFIPMATKAKIFSTRRFPSPVPKPQGPPAYVIKSTENMGMGVFASRDIKVGELVFAERALLLSPQDLSMPKPIPHDKETLYDCNSFGANAVILAEWEKLTEKALEKMMPEDRAAYKELTDNRRGEGDGPLLGIRRTNSFGIPPSFTHTGETYCGVLKIGSRVNHSCKPNIMNRFSVPSFSFQFWATADIAAGEELFYPYCSMYGSKAQRQAQLANDYGFICQCPACTYATPETDRLRREFMDRAVDFMSKTVFDSDSEAITQLQQGLEFREALVMEGLHCTAEYIATLKTIIKLYHMLGLMAQSQLAMEEDRQFEKSLTNFVNAHEIYSSFGAVS